MVKIRLRKLPPVNSYTVIEFEGDSWNYGMSVHDNDSITKIANRFIDFGHMILEKELKNVGKKVSE